MAKASKAPSSYTDRLRAAAKDLATAEGKVADAREVRDRLIVEARDTEGLSIRAIGAAAGVSDSSVMKVLTGSSRFQP